MEEASKNCEECKASDNEINKLKSALQEVVNQNSTLRTRTIELEAIMNEIDDTTDTKTQKIKELQDQLQNLQSSCTQC